MTAGVVGVLTEALAEHDYDISEVHQRMCVCGEKVDDMPRHRASVVAALPNIAIVPTSGRVEVITHAQNGDLIAREIGTSRHIAIAHIGSQPHSFANAPEALALKAEGYAALAARASGGQA